jgi:O-antigen ligase/polysaccharide polymerase Wzy-like membrane protein
MWSAGYLALSIIWYAGWPSDAAAQELADRVLAVCFMAAAAFVLADLKSRRLAGLLTVVVVLVMVAVNWLQVMDPESFVMNMPTRSSGLYLNANQCASALVLGMLIAWPSVNGRLRPLFLLVVGAGVVVTFSRSGILGWMLAGTVLLAFEAQTLKRLLLGSLAVLTLAIVLVQAASAVGLIDHLILDDDQFDRVSFLNTLQASDESAQVRVAIAADAWQMVAESPIVGNGLASTVRWDDLQSTHNMFLYYMADHGLLGVLILPALVFCAFVGRRNAAPGPYWAFCAFTLWYALFSHNITTERYHLFAFAFFAMGGMALERASAGTQANRLADREAGPAFLTLPRHASGSVR